MDGKVTNIIPVLCNFLPGSRLDVFQDNETWAVCPGIADYSPERTTGFAFLVKCLSVIVQSRKVNARESGNQDVGVLRDFL